ncbi:MAG: hypothetical protein R3343_12120 [Nitriliruptorales bacterium]|nr:hypothetical protein [Nitriliruptorales bacterium]
MHDSRRRLAAAARSAGRRTYARIAFLVAGTVAFLLSVSLWFLLDEPEQAIFVGLWVPSLFSLGALVLAGGERR